jgi:hypothetical protein
MVSYYSSALAEPGARQPGVQLCARGEQAPRCVVPPEDVRDELAHFPTASTAEVAINMRDG